jgi:hypothetical protein
LKTRTYIFTFMIETEGERTAVDAALAKLSTELELTHPLRLKGGHRSLITIPGIDPDETWAALDTAVPEWRQLFLPRSTR